MQLLFLQQRFQLLLLLDVGMGADHAQRLPIGGTCNHATAVEHPAPLAILLAEAELGAVLLAVAAQVLVQRRTHVGQVIAVDAGNDVVGGLFHKRRCPYHPVAGNVPVPQAVAGAFQRQLPTATGIDRHRLRHAEGEGQQVAAAIVHGAQVAVVVAARTTRQGAGDDATVGRQQAQVLQHRRVGGHRRRQAVFARGRVGCKRTAATVDDDQRRGKRMLQQAGDDPLVHAILLRNGAPDSGARSG